MSLRTQSSSPPARLFYVCLGVGAVLLVSNLSSAPVILFHVDQTPVTGSFKITNAVTSNTNYWGALGGSGSMPTVIAGARSFTTNAWQFNKGNYLGVGPDTVTKSLGDITNTLGLTVACWFKYQSQTTDNSVRLCGLGNNGEVFDLMIVNAGSGVGVGQVQFTAGYQPDNSRWVSITPSTVVFDGTWHHFVGTVDFRKTNSNVVVYLDGVAAQNATSSPLVRSFTNTGSLKIGARGSGTTWGGAIDQFIIFTNALMAAEVMQLYGLGQMTNYAPMVSLPGSAWRQWTNGAVSVSLPLTATLTDDGLPNPPGRVTNLWTCVRGPASVSFGNSTNAATVATFTNFGDYILRCTAGDGALIDYDEVSVHVNSPLEEAITNLQVQVNALPGTNTAQQLKKAVLNLALEQATNCVAVNYLTDASNRVADVQGALSTDPAVMVAMNPNATNIGSLVPPFVTHGNPYLATMQAGLSNTLAAADVPWGKTTTNAAVLTSTSGNYYMRDVGEYMEAYLWLFVNPASSSRTNVEVLTRLLRRAHAYADTVDVQGAQYGPGTFFYDDFAIAPFSGAIREFAWLHPGLLLPSQKAMWDRAMTKASATMWGKVTTDTSRGRYANIDILEAYQFLNFGLYLTNQTYLEKARWLIDMRTNDLYADGAWAYIWTQNESRGYHSVNTDYIARYWLVSGYSLCTNLLQRSQWYGPVSNGRAGEFWTMPSWKQLWNTATPDTGGEQAIAFSGNGYLRWMQDTYLLPGAVADTASWSSRRWDVTFYRNDITPKALPDNYTFLDRNIVGPSAWYGTFHYAAPGRSPNDTEPGEATLMGAGIQESNTTLWNAIVMGVYPRVREVLSTNQPGTDNGRFDWAWLTAKLTNDFMVGRDFSAITATYRMHKYGSSTKGTEYNWRGRQLWLGLSDRLIGWLSVSPDAANATAYEVDGVVRLGTGGTVNSLPKTIQDLGGGAYTYGNLRVTILDHNYGSLQPIVVPFRLTAYPATEITLQDPRSIPTDGTNLLTYSTNEEYAFVVEVRPTSATSAATVSRQTDANGLRTLTAGVSNATYRLIYNPGATALAYSNTIVCVHSNAAWFNGWQAQSPQVTFLPVVGGLATVQTTIPARGQIVFVNAADQSLLQPGPTNGTAFFTQVTKPPKVCNITLAGANIIITGTNGTAAASYLLLTTTNLALPTANWTVLATNQFGPGGGFDFTLPVEGGAPQRFYRVKLF